MRQVMNIIIFIVTTGALFANGPKSLTRDRLSLLDAEAVPCRTYHCHHHCDDAGAELVFWTFIALGYGGQYSVAYMDERERGELLLPILRVESSFLYDDARRGAYGTLIEGGWGFLGARANYWDHFDVSTDDHVAMITWHLLYRATFGEYLEIDLGGGGIEIGGDNEKHGGSGVFGVRWRPDERLSVEYFRSWHDIEREDYSEHDLAFRVNLEGVHFKLGYRYLGLPERNLKGPYAGIGVTF